MNETTGGELVDQRGTSWSINRERMM